MPPRAVLLDLYDTLVDGDWHGWRTQLSTLTGIDEDALAMAYHVTREERNTGAYPTADDSMRALLVAAGLEAPPDALVRTVVKAEEDFGGSVRLYDDSLPTVATLRERGIRTALVLSFEIGVRKPEPGIYETALRAIEADPAHAIFVDDQTAYCDGARALGIDTRLIVRDGAAPAEGFAASTNGHTVITDLTSLL